ncbi:MAG: hypothetical protein A2140_10520 [Candidatus Muproteobacteria bacterium RBG_16_62_13]|uniref:PepSY domain-containing protein n=1 Tax=Candidatus Muproteobacteria bacterium RBG_16_62_13 TaxID=1817756 RepID=A0A1F6T115_9PROT|nr:MAG: hypothetical protein A2140_10520 [Candidatus Muproteobacteria bacterium RBG_16_62_13]
MATLRQFHFWTGVIACVFVVLLAVTGIVLDHRDQLKVGGKIAVDNRLAITRGFKPEELPISPSKAIEIAITHLGEGATLRKVELKKAGNGLVYKVETKSKDVVHIDPVTGAVHTASSGGLDIVRVSKMIHTGEGLINSPWLYDVVALALIFLAVSGAVLFVRRQLR